MESYRSRGVASIPGRTTSLNVQLGPAADDNEDNDSGQQEQQQRTPPGGGPARASRQPTVPPPQQQRVRWSRLAAVPQPQPPPPSPPMLALASAVTAATRVTSASLCQLVDFGETRDLIRRQREATKKLAEVTSIVSHLSLDNENSQDQFERYPAGSAWSTFRPQANSQFKQYVFQSPGRPPQLPSAAEPPLRRSRTTLLSLQASSSSSGGCCQPPTASSGRRWWRHSRPETLGAFPRRQQDFGFSRASTNMTATTTAETADWGLHRASSNLQLGAAAAARHHGDEPHQQQQKQHHHLCRSQNNGASSQRLVSCSGSVEQ